MRFPAILQIVCMILASSFPGLSKESSPAPAQTLILDGIWGSHSRWERLRNRITTEVGPCRIWRYDNSGRTSLESLAADLSTELQRIDAPVNLVGYSMGGIVVREALRQAPGLKVRRVVLLNSPHYGSASAMFLPLSRLPGNEAGQRLPQAAQCGRVDLPDPRDLVSPRSRGGSRIFRPLERRPALGRTDAYLADRVWHNSSIHRIVPRLGRHAGPKAQEVSGAQPKIVEVSFLRVGHLRTARANRLPAGRGVLGR